MALDLENRSFAEPEIVDSPVDLSGFNPQIFQNQFALGQQALPDYSNFNLSAFQPQTAAPAYSLPTPQPVQSEPYYGDYNFDPYNIGSFGAPATSSAYSLPTAQPVQTAPYADYATQAPAATSGGLTALSPQPSLPYAAAPRRAALSTSPDAMYAPSYSDTTQQYLNQINQLAGSYKPNIGSFYSAVPTTSYTTEDYADGNRYMPVYASEEDLAPYLSLPPEQNLRYSFDVPSNKNSSTGSVNVGYNTPIALVNNATGELVYSGVGFDAAQKVADMARQLSATEGKKAQWQIYTAPPGATDVSQFAPVATEKKDKSFLGSILSIAAPVLGSILLPGIGGGIGAALTGALGTVGTGALGAALGSGALGVARGESLGTILKNAALSGAGAFAGGTLGNALGAGGSKAATSALSNAAGSAGSTTGSLAGSTLGQAATSGLDDIVVNALINRTPQLIGSGLGTAGTTALSSILNSMPSMQFKPDNMVDLGNGQSYNLDTNEIVVTGSPSSALAGTGAVIGGGLGSLVGGAPGTAPGGTQDIVVTGNPGGELPPVGTNVGAGVGGVTGGGNDIVVTGNPGTKPDLGTSTGSAVGGVGSDIVVTGKPTPSTTTEQVIGSTAGAGAGGATSSSGGDTSGKNNGKSTIGKIVGGLTIADALAKIISKLAGGGGSGGTSPGGQQLQSVFSAKLPRATGIFAPENLAPRDMSGTDWLRYGYGPEKAFFQNVPTSAAERTMLTNAYRPSQLSLSGTGGATAPSTYVSDPTAMLGQLSAELAAAGISEADFNAFLQSTEGQQALAKALGVTGYAHGGSTPMRYAKRPARESFAVEGPGTGRSDEIPAALSDGEYVIDAETVALLGDGSSKAGAKKLDEFRVNVRKHKGRNLAKGQFSVNAKRPEKYLSGGRT